MTHHAVRIHEHGGPEVLSYEAVDVPEPGPGEVRLAHTAVGLNYIDVYHRTGLYPVPELPCTLGLEAAGTVAAVGPDVTAVSPGDRVAYAESMGTGQSVVESGDQKAKDEIESLTDNVLNAL